MNAQVQHQETTNSGSSMLQQLDIIQQQVLMVHLHQGETQKQLEIILTAMGYKAKANGLRLCTE